MAESDADRARSGAVTTEEADRLSEQFRPSWEEDPPTVRRDQLAPPVASPVATPAIPEAKGKVNAPLPSAAVSRAPVVAVTAAKPETSSSPTASAASAPTASAPSSSAGATPRPGAVTAPGSPLALKAPKRATLLGVAPSPAKANAPLAKRGQGADDLDWEAPAVSSPSSLGVAANGPTSSPAVAISPSIALEAPMQIEVEELPAEPPLQIDVEELPDEAAAHVEVQTPPAEPPMHVDVEELPPESKPSGIGQKYIPKEEGAPAVVLGEDVQAAEYGARAQLEAEHRTRGAPTIARLRAVDIPLPTPATLAVEFVPPKRRGRGGLFVLGLFVVAGGAAAAFVVTRPDPQVASETVEGRPAEAAAAPDTKAPPPPGLPAAEPPAALPTAPPPETAAAPTPSLPPQEAPVAAKTREEQGPVAPAGKPTGASPKPSPPAAAKPTAAAKPVAAKPAPSPKPAAKPTPAKPSAASGSKSMIVRDNPF